MNQDGDLLVRFTRSPHSVLLIKKPASELATFFLIYILHFLRERKLQVFVESNVISEIPEHTQVVELWKNEAQKRANSLDMIITIGGDGTVLHASSLFPLQCPPILALNVGTLGFLAPFSPCDVIPVVENIFSGDEMNVFRRQRINCKVMLGNPKATLFSDAASLVALNEVSLEGRSGGVCSFDVLLNEKYITRIDGNGVLVSTATGSTAYSLSAGGTVTYPTFQGIQLTPILPLNLNPKPIILPKEVRLDIKLSSSTKSDASVYIDGKETVILDLGDYLHITAAIHPCTFFSRKSYFYDWIENLSRCFNWNYTERQFYQHHPEPKL